MRELADDDGEDDGFSAPPRGSVEDGFRRIRRLRDLGALTPAEYERAMTKLLQA
jgi:hypothetical protein